MVLGLLAAGMMALVVGGCAAPPTYAMTSQALSVPAQSPLDEIGDTEVPQAPSGAVFDGGQAAEMLTTETVAAQLQAVVLDADRVWTSYLTSVGLREPFVSYQIVTPGYQFQSRCLSTPITSAHPNAYYCGIDGDPADPGAIILPVDTFMNMWDGSIFGRQSAQVGDFAAATIVAHEFGHHVQDELRRQARLPEIVGVDAFGRPVRLKEKELIADCFAGVWANTAYYSGYLTDTDKEEAVAALESIGDAETGGADPHGSPAERKYAFEMGYDNGAPAMCINAYWPGVRA
ncbi:neutral zinc metallopeptidase [Actinomycetospora sp. CA-084318]|uniref:neutral zinc metallopeptidase n=1 Tax=Actinomycetospora sp. CA-084318 TaxID=3239892 RepID=UPI003D960480